MKKNYIVKIAAFISAATVFASCTEELALQWERVDKESGVSYHEVQILASNPAEEVKPETKAYIESDGDGGYISKWNEGDQIALFQKNSVDGYRTKVTSKKTDLTLTDGGKTASFAVTLAETDGATDYKYWAAYPDGAVGRSSNDLTFAIPETQTFTANMFDKAADVMVSQPVERAVYSSDPLEMGFARIGTVAKMTLKGLTAGETLKSVTFSTTETDKYLAGTVKYDLENDVLKSGVSSGKQTLTLTAGESIVVPASGQVDVWFRTAEVTLSDNFTVVVYTRDDSSQNYSYTKSVNLASAGKTLAFNSGRMTTFGVTGLSSGKETLDYEPLIAEGYYVLHVVNTTADYDMALSNVGSGYLEAVDNPLTPDANSKYNASSHPELIWRLEFDEKENKYALFSPEVGKYVTGTDAISANASSASWYYMGENIDDYAGTYSVYNGSAFDTAKHIGFNSSASPERFKFYAAPITNYPGYFTFTPAYSAPVVTYANVNLPSSDEIADPVSIFPTDLLFMEDIDVVGVYNDALCSSDADWLVASVADSVTGEIHYLAEENTDDSPRTAYVKVLAIGENALETNVVFSITQPEAGGSATIYWTKVTDVSQLASGDEIIFVNEDGKVAMSKTQNTNNRGSVDITTVIDSENHRIADDDMLGDIQVITLGNSNTHWTFFTGSGYLYAASSSSNHLKTQAANDANGEWTISITSGDATITAHGTNTHNMLRRNGAIFSCYSSGQDPVQIYRKDGPHGCGLSYAVTTVVKSVNDAAFTNALSNPYSLTVAYSSSDPSVATVNSSTGEVSIVGAGSTTITATWAGSVDYTAGSASYSLTVYNEHTVSWSAPTNGTLTVSVGGSPISNGDLVRDGSTVTVTATPNSGYQLSALAYNDGTEHDIKDSGYFTMPVANVTISTSFVVAAAEIVSTLTFSEACGGTGTADDGIMWTVTSDGTESNYDATKGIHYGTGSAAVQYIKLTTSGIDGTITKVVVNASTASGVSATASVTVGGSPFGGDAQALSSSASNYTFSGSASGEIIVTVTKPSSATKALYVKSIAVTYE